MLPEHINIIFLSNKFDAFINKNINAQLSQYYISKQEEIAKLPEKKYFQSYHS